MINEILQDYKVILASGSEPRKQILNQLGIKFTVIIPDCKEECDPSVGPIEYVKVISKLKMDAAIKLISGYKENDKIFIISADTIMYFNNKILGKPKGENEAFQVLLEMKGKQLECYTGLMCTLIESGKIITNISFENTIIQMRDYDEIEIKAYLNSLEYIGRAGSYAIQGKGAQLIEKLNGCYFNVVGLPINCLIKLTKNLIKLKNN